MQIHSDNPAFDVNYDHNCGMTVPAVADTISHTDCSRGYSSNSTRMVGKNWHQTTYGGIFNFSPGYNGYSPMTGHVSCDTQSHQIYLYLADLFSQNWKYTAGETDLQGGTVFVSAIDG